MKKQIQRAGFEEKVSAYIKAEGGLLVKHKLAKKLIVSFPKRKGKSVPFWGKVGMWLVRTSGGIIDTMYTDAGGRK